MYKNIEITSNTIKVVKDTSLFVAENIGEIVALMYRNLFKRYPKYIFLFNQSNQPSGNNSQHHSISKLLVEFALSFPDLSLLTNRLKVVIAKHDSLGIVAEDYEAVAECLLLAIQEKAGVDSSDQIIFEWGNAYWHLANNLIAEEKYLQDNKQSEYGWRGLKKLKVIYARPSENNNCTLIRLANDDNKPLPLSKPLQYISIYLKDLELHRQYSLTANSGDYFEIAVKTIGLASNYLKEITVGALVECSMPAGGSQLSELKNDVFLFSCGIGVTPHISFLRYAKYNMQEKRIIHFYSAKNSISNPFSLFDDDYSGSPNICNIAFFSDENNEFDNSNSYCKLSPHNKFDGRINFDSIKSTLIDPLETSCFVCGSPDYSEDVYAMLLELGIKKENIHQEFFQPY